MTLWARSWREATEIPSFFNVLNMQLVRFFFFLLGVMMQIDEYSLETCSEMIKLLIRKRLIEHKSTALSPQAEAGKVGKNLKLFWTKKMT